MNGDEKINLITAAEQSMLITRVKRIFLGGTSVPSEKAQEIMTSILFVIGQKLKSCQSPEQV